MTKELLETVSFWETMVRENNSVSSLRKTHKAGILVNEKDTVPDLMEMTICYHGVLMCV